MKNFTPSPLAKTQFLAKKRGPPKIRQKFNQLGFGWNFQDNPRPKKEWDWEWKILPPLSQNSILGKKGGTQNQVKNSTKSDFAQIFRVTPAQWKNGIEDENFYPPSAKIKFKAKKRGGGTPNQAKIQPTWIWLKLPG